MRARSSYAFFAWLLPAVVIAHLHCFVVGGLIFCAILYDSEKAANLAVSLSFPFTLLPYWPVGGHLYLAGIFWGGLVGVTLRWILLLRRARLGAITR